MPENASTSRGSAQQGILTRGRASKTPIFYAALGGACAASDCARGKFLPRKEKRRRRRRPAAAPAPAEQQEQNKSAAGAAAPSASDVSGCQSSTTLPHDMTAAAPARGGAQDPRNLPHLLAAPIYCRRVWHSELMTISITIASPSLHREISTREARNRHFLDEPQWGRLASSRRHAHHRKPEPF